MSRTQLIKSKWNGVDKKQISALDISFLIKKAEKVEQLEEEVQKLRKENLWISDLMGQLHDKDEQIKRLKQDIEKVMEIYADI